MLGITKAGKLIEGTVFTGEELVAVILTKGDDKPETMEELTMNIFPRMTDAADDVLRFRGVDFQRTGQPLLTLENESPE